MRSQEINHVLLRTRGRDDTDAGEITGDICEALTYSPPGQCWEGCYTEQSSTTTDHPAGNSSVVPLHSNTPWRADSPEEPEAFGTSTACASNKGLQ